MYDLAGDVYRFRPLTDVPLDPARLEYRDNRERIAHDLQARRGAVKIVSENRIPGTGLELTGQVTVSEDRREYRPQLLLAEEGQVDPRRLHLHGLPQAGVEGRPVRPPGGPRLAYAEQEARRLEGLDPNQVITVETRTYSRRRPGGEEVYQVSLERRRLKIRWGLDEQARRSQTLTFDSLEERGVPSSPGPPNWRPAGSSMRPRAKLMKLISM